ncbi:hypothetical protein MTAT_19590 [Moorella thermoacetica]|uniref:T4 RNA ligase 1-like N-terminal domain-containing protein n=1 Tax=Neomoorella thermoacetica TaxID=1525 RepID=A0ABY3N4S9_NEOTH|nr:RNA ligase [Moorella thermoacetica]TYL12717.1 hypothetical protein MTAT_19590 [Moorella thermoacetica]
MVINKLEEFAPYIEKGLITATHHPDDFDIVILNYTNKCQYDACWDAITTKCRGLILNTKTGEVLARPFDKFFNFFEIKDPLPPGIPEVTVKMDGSLGISYRLNGRLLWATRGSFTGPQAMAAQEIWDSKYAAVHPPR